jgi:predicted anti-sigma-YlaC factor YlaD
MKVEMCRDMLGDLSDYLDGQASDDICAEIERHMAGCEDCRICRTPPASVSTRHLISKLIGRPSSRFALVPDLSLSP